MKKITYFYLEACPHCKRARRWMNELKLQNPAYDTLEIVEIEERKHPEIAKKFDYYYVPTYYVDDVKVHEGVASREKIEMVFHMALESSVAVG